MEEKKKKKGHNVELDHLNENAFETQPISFRIVRYDRISFVVKLKQMQMTSRGFFTAIITAFLRDDPLLLEFLNTLPYVVRKQNHKVRSKMNVKVIDKEKEMKVLDLNELETAEIFDIIAREGPDI